MYLYQKEQAFPHTAEGNYAVTIKSFRDNNYSLGAIEIKIANFLAIHLIDASAHTGQINYVASPIREHLVERKWKGGGRGGDENTNARLSKSRRV